LTRSWREDSTSGVELSRRGLIGAGAALALTGANGADPTVGCSAGRFTGLIEHGVKVFRGIRYGRAERFCAPLREGPVSARSQSFAPASPQAGTNYAPYSEDCLFLNIWTPDAHPRADRPVMVYFHGGAYSTGSVTDPLNDGGRLAAAGNVVVVTVNHRLNAFGYLYLARLDPRFPDSGNAGQLDLMLALRWVQENIAGFGGDPNRVMVFGQSGGGAKIATLMGMPAATSLFHCAATMSGQQVTASGPLNATARARSYLTRLGVREQDVSPLLRMPWQRLVEALDATDPILSGGVYFGPVLDMRWLHRHPFWPDANPQSNAIPLVLGNTRDETRGFLGPDHAKLQGLDWTNLSERMGAELRIDIAPEWVVARYRERFPDLAPRELFWRATTAARSWRGQVEEAEARARANAPTWVYQLDFGSPLEPERGAFHTFDIPLVFGTLEARASLTGTGTKARQVSEAMMRSFIRLAAAGEPDWPQYRLDRRTTRIFDAPPRLDDDPRRWERELFARVPYVQPGT
jgi:para-nitrobenzyl esterase